MTRPTIDRTSQAPRAVTGRVNRVVLAGCGVLFLAGAAYGIVRAPAEYVDEVVTRAREERVPARVVDRRCSSSRHAGSLCHWELSYTTPDGVARRAVRSGQRRVGETLDVYASRRDPDTVYLAESRCCEAGWSVALAVLGGFAGVATVGGLVARTSTSSPFRASVGARVIRVVPFALATAALAVVWLPWATVLAALATVAAAATGPRRAELAEGSLTLHRALRPPVTVELGPGTSVEVISWRTHRSGGGGTGRLRISDGRSTVRLHTSHFGAEEPFHAAVLRTLTASGVPDVPEPLRRRVAQLPSP